MGHDRCVRALTAAGANVEATNCNGETPLHMAAGECHTACVEALLEAGARTSAADDIDKDTALHYAARSGSLSGIQCLANAGADLAVCNNIGQSARQVALLADKAEAAQLLLDLGEAQPGAAR